MVGPAGSQLGLDIGERLPPGAVSYEIPPFPGNAIALDLETTGLSPLRDEIVAVLIHVGKRTYIRRPDSETREWIRAVLDDPKRTIVTQNGHAFDMPFIALWLGERDFKAKFFDTTVAASALEPGESTALEKLYSRWLEEDVRKDRTLTKGGFVWPLDRERMTADQEAYCHDDVRLLIRLASALIKEADKRGIRERLELEMAIQPSISALHMATMPVDVDGANQRMMSNAGFAIDALHEVRRYGLNDPRSNQVVDKWLRDQNVHLDDVRENTLRVHARHVPGVEDLIKFRHAEKENNALRSMIAANDREGGFRGSYRQCGTETGRFTARGVNTGAGSTQIQAIDRNLRHLFRYEDAWMVVADYSGLELRVHAMFHDADLAQAFREGRDPHDETQGRMSLDERRLAKNLNFGLSFAAGAKTIWKHLQIDDPDMPFEVAQDLRNRWHAAWPETARHIQLAYRDKLPRDIVGPRGFRAVVPEKRNTASSVLNWPVQSTAAMGAKLALVRLQEAGLHHRLLLVLHDEIALGPFSDRHDADCAERLLVECMKEGMEEAVREMRGIRDSGLHEVPIEVESVVSHSWQH